MMFDYSKLTGRIIERYGSKRAFAEAAGISMNTLSRKLNHKVSISTSDIVKWSSKEFLDISPVDYHEYFFVA